MQALQANFGIQSGAFTSPRPVTGLHGNREYCSTYDDISYHLTERFFERVSLNKLPPSTVVKGASSSCWNATRKMLPSETFMRKEASQLRSKFKRQLVLEARAVTTAERDFSSPPSAIATGLEATSSSLLGMVPEQKHEELDLDFPNYNPETSVPIDLIVVGAGPAGLAVAQQVSAAGLRVCCVDPSPKAIWPNNYGVWVDEFKDMGLADCLDYTWSKAVVYLDDDKTKYLDRPYGRVNRVRLKTKMMKKCVDHGVMFYQSKVDKVVHDEHRSLVTCSDGTCIEAAVVLDATGFSRRLVEYDEPFDPGYQAAWGILAVVESHPFELDKMLFMDWRDSHLHEDPEMQRENEALPTFLYAMPFSENRVFLEETSLVARPAVKFSDIQRRLEARLKHLGIKVLSIEEEEYCLIPMGGVLPSIPQRVLGIGGTAGMVHPSTGYMVARTLATAPLLADAIVQKLAGRHLQEQSFSSSSGEEGHSFISGSAVETTSANVAEEASAPYRLAGGDDLSARIWEEVWPIGRREQREFFCFGMDVLLKLNLKGTRRFFDAFFDLSPFHWQGFLSSRLYLIELLGFGLSLFAHATNPARLEIMANGLPGLGVLIKNVVKMRSQVLL